MNTESVSEWLTAMGVPPEVVSIGVEADDSWCLLRVDVDGYAGWEVFWREQGNRYDWARFSSEQVACFYLFGRLTWTQVLRGVVGPLDAARTPPHGFPLPGGQQHGQAAPAEHGPNEHGSAHSTAQPQEAHAPQENLPQPPEADAPPR